MSPQQVRLYCSYCRRSLSPRSFNLAFWEGSKFKVCQSCVERLESQDAMVVASKIVIESEAVIQIALQEQEGGEREVETPVGLADLVTDEWVIEIKHVSNWKEASKVLVYARFFGDRKPRVHLFGGYSKEFRQLVDKVYSDLGVAVTWERDPF
jgi:hypothetical protein